jgi:two-component system sensor histidine kinase/response regulator
MHATSVASAPEAIAQMRRASERGQPFGLVLTDVHMPDMDGFELVERIHQSPKLTKAVILMLTSGEHRGDLARCKELGVSAYLIKPVRRAELRSAIIRAIADQSGNHPGEPMLTASRVRNEPRGPGRHILLAEDNIVNQRVARMMLEKAGHTVVIANTGKEALALHQAQRFDLILTDVQMPEMDGLEATAIIREGEKTSGAHIPIIAMTAHAMTGDRERCLTAGTDDYISKPIQSAKLLELVARYSSVIAENLIRDENTGVTTMDEIITFSG